MAAVLAACGAGNSQNLDTVTGGGSPNLGPTSNVPVGGGKIYTKQNVVVTQPAEGTFKAFSATCTHMGCQVSQVQDRMIECLCHGSAFSIADGSVEQGPARAPLPAEKITVANGEITLA